MMRGILLVSNDEAKRIATASSLRFEAPLSVHTDINGVYPISPKDIEQNWDMLGMTDDIAIVELMCEPDKHGTITGLQRENIISVNLNRGMGVFTPHRMFKPYCMFTHDTNILTDELGWKHPMPGVSWVRNKQCMSKSAYEHMMDVLSNKQGSIVVTYIEQLFQTSLITQDIIDEYKL